MCIMRVRRLLIPPDASYQPARIAAQTPAPRGRALLADAGVSIVVGLMTISYALSYATLLFAGLPAEAQAQGLFMLLVSVLALSVTGALLSTVPVTFLSLEGSSIAAMAVGSAALTAEMHARGADPRSIAVTMAVGLTLSAVITGVIMTTLGQCRVGGVVRFVPLQVMAGVIAASGWSLLMGGIAVVARAPAGVALASQPEVWPMLGAGLAMAAVLIVAVPLFRSALALPVLVAGLIATHHAVCAGLGFTVAQQRASGWLTAEPVPARALMLWQNESWTGMDWAALSHQVPALFTIITISTICALLNTSGLEIAARRDIDLDRDLRANGIAAIVAGLCGGVVGSLSLSRTVLLLRLGSGKRRAPIAAGVLAALIPLGVPSLLGLIPRPVLGALLMYVAAGILRTWTIDIRHRLSRVEWLSVLAVLATGVQFGLVAGIVVGLGLGCATFAFMYSLGSPIRARYGGDVAQSNVARPEADRAALQAQSGALLVLYIQGFLFFGTASRLLQDIKRDIAAAGGRLRFLVLDGSNIDGLDGSARAMLERLLQIAGQDGITVILAALSPAHAQRLGVIPGLRLEPNLDHALEQCEDAMLLHAAGTPARPFMVTLIEELTNPADAAALAQVLVRSAVPSGVVLMAQGEASADLMFLESGRASVMVAYGEAPAIRVRSYGAGTMLGEIGFLLGTPRTATVRTDMACELWTLTRAGMEQLERDSPGAALALQRSVMRRLSVRLLDKDQLVAALLRGTRRQG